MTDQQLLLYANKMIVMSRKHYNMLNQRRSYEASVCREKMNEILDKLDHADGLSEVGLCANEKRREWRGSRPS